MPRLSTSGWNAHWSISLQNNQRLSGCAWTLQDTRSSTSTNLHARDSLQRLSRRSHNPASSLATSFASTSTGVTTSPDGESLDSWATSNNLGLLYKPKKTASFFSRRLNVGTNPDQTFASLGQESRLPDRRILGKLPQSQHRPSLITPPRFKDPAHSDPAKRWNIRKVDWKNFCLLIDFSHSSRKAWRTFNKLTGRYGRSSRVCPVSENSIASQLVKNGAHKTSDREPTRLVNKQLSDLWKIPTPEGHSISEPFRPEEFAAALRRLKPGKSPGLDSIFPEFILHAG